jgi:hypothetical protein
MLKDYTSLYRSLSNLREQHNALIIVYTINDVISYVADNNPDYSKEQVLAKSQELWTHKLIEKLYNSMVEIGNEQLGYNINTEEV